MRRFFLVWALSVMSMAALSPAVAVEVSGLYEAEVPVTGQSREERVAASRTALEEVLVKVTGSAEVLQQPEIVKLLDQADQWVQRYQYRAAPPVPQAPPAMETPPPEPAAQIPASNDTSELIPAEAPPPPAPGQLLWMAFDRETINQRLAEAGLPVWGVNRPRTLLWLAVEDNGERYLVGGDNRSDLQKIITDQARHRGLPLSLPLMDLQDQAALTVTDVWGDFSDVILNASERYQADAVLVGRVYLTAPGQWEGHWTLYHRGANSSWDSTAAAETDVVMAGVGGATEQFAKRYALTLTADAADSMTLTIDNIASLNDYAHALNYLQSLDPVAAVQIVRVEGDAVSYRLKVRGEPQAVVRSIGWGKTLITDEQPLSLPGNGVIGNSEEASPAGGEYRYRIVP